jgi:uncharacterized protein
MIIKNFEWDENKRTINLSKHGIDFVDSVYIFQDPDRIEMESVQNEEIRYQTIGTVHHVVLLIVYVYRDGKRRIISARRASKKERDVYNSLRCDHER